MSSHRVKKINEENRVKELANEVVKQALKERTDKDEIKALAKEVAKEAIFDIVNKNKDRRYQNTKLLMENYNSLKKHIEGKLDGVDIKLEFRDETGEIYVKSDYMWLESISKSKARTKEMLRYVDEKLEFLKYKYEKLGKYEIVDSFIMFYIDEKTDDDIREKHSCGYQTPRRWREKAIGELSVLLWGIDAIKM